MFRSMVLIALMAMSSLVFAQVTPFGVLEQNVVITENDGVSFDHDDSLVGMKGAEMLRSDLAVHYKLSLGLKKGVLEDKSVSLHSKDLGMITIGSFRSFMRMESDRTINIFEASSGHRAAFYDFNRDSVSYISPAFQGMRFGVAGVVAGNRDIDERDIMEYMIAGDMGMIHVAGVLRRVGDVDHKLIVGKMKLGILRLSGGWEDNNGADAILAGLIVPAGKNALRLGARKGGGNNTLTGEVSHMFGMNTRGSLNLQHITHGDDIVDLIDEGDKIVSMGLRHNF